MEISTPSVEIKNENESVPSNLKADKSEFPLDLLEKVDSNNNNENIQEVTFYLLFRNNF